MSRGLIILIVILVIFIAAIIALYFIGRRMQKRQAEQQEQLDAMKQTISMFIISKKRLRMKDSGLPQMVIDQTPFYLRRSKVPVLKAKVGPQVMTLMCDAAIFDSVPEKREVKATISGIYVTSVRGLHGKQTVKEEKKQGFFGRAVAKLQEKGGAKPIK